MNTSTFSIGHLFALCACIAVIVKLVLELLPLPSTLYVAENLFDWNFPLELLCFVLCMLYSGRAAGHTNIPISFGIGSAFMLLGVAWLIAQILAPDIAILFLASAGAVSIFLVSSMGRRTRTQEFPELGKYQNGPGT